MDNCGILKKNKEKIPWIYKIWKVMDSTSDFFSLKFPLLLRLSRSDESDKADIVLNLLSSKQQTSLSLAEKFYFYRRGRGGHINSWFVGEWESKSNAKMVCSFKKIDTYANTPFCWNLPAKMLSAIDMLDNKKANQNGPMMYWKEMHTYAKRPFRRNIPAK